MKLKNTIKILALIFCGGIATASINSCTTTSAEYKDPDPLSQQIQQQEKMSEVTRSMIR
jgi:hypothetical protein